MRASDNNLGVWRDAVDVGRDGVSHIRAVVIAECRGASQVLNIDERDGAAGMGAGFAEHATIMRECELTVKTEIRFFCDSEFLRDFRCEIKAGNLAWNSPRIAVKPTCQGFLVFIARCGWRDRRRVLRIASGGVNSQSARFRGGLTRLLPRGRSIWNTRWSKVSHHETRRTQPGGPYGPATAHHRATRFNHWAAATWSTSLLPAGKKDHLRRGLTCTTPRRLDV